MVSKYFRGVDCANPNIDFEGSIIIASDEVVTKLDIPKDQIVKVKGISLEKKCEDNIKNISAITDYNHMANVFHTACAEAKIDFIKLFRNREALLEVYTCYPIVPLAFLLKTGFISMPTEIFHFLKFYPITFTGGLNLAKAPWNNTTLSAIINACQILKQQKTKYIGVHSNGATGYQQGFVVLTKA